MPLQVQSDASLLSQLFIQKRRRPSRSLGVEVSIDESAVRKSGTSRAAYSKQEGKENRNTTLLLRCEDGDFTRSTCHRLLRPGRMARCAHCAWARHRSVPICRRCREAENPNWSGLVTLVALQPATGSGGGPLCRPLHRRHPHAEWPVEIEKGGGLYKPWLVRTDRRRRPRLVGPQRARW